MIYDIVCVSICIPAKPVDSLVNKLFVSQFTVFLPKNAKQGLVNE